MKRRFEDGWKNKKLEMQKMSYEMRVEIIRKEIYINVKLPKLIITKTEGTHTGSAFGNSLNLKLIG